MRSTPLPTLPFVGEVVGRGLWTVADNIAHIPTRFTHTASLCFGFYTCKFVRYRESSRLCRYCLNLPYSSSFGRFLLLPIPISFYTKLVSSFFSARPNQDMACIRCTSPDSAKVRPSSLSSADKVAIPYAATLYNGLGSTPCEQVLTE